MNKKYVIIIAALLGLAIAIGLMSSEAERMVTEAARTRAAKRALVEAGRKEASLYRAIDRQLAKEKTSAYHTQKFETTFQEHGAYRAYLGYNFIFNEPPPEADLQALAKKVSELPVVVSWKKDRPAGIKVKDCTLTVEKTEVGALYLKLVLEESGAPDPAKRKVNVER